MIIDNTPDKDNQCVLKMVKGILSDMCQVALYDNVLQQIMRSDNHTIGIRVSEDEICH